MRMTRSGHGCDNELRVPDGFCATVFADDVGPARHLVVTPAGFVYVATWREGERRGGIVALRDTNADGRADVRESFGPEGGSGLALRDSTLYFATWGAVYRYRLSASSLRPVAGPDTVVVGLPPLEHGARSIAVDQQDNLFVNIGVPSNACERDYPRRDFRGDFPCAELATSGGIWRFAADGRMQRQSSDKRYATGLRHTVALAVSPIDGRLYGAPHGIDHLRTWWPAANYSAEDAATIPSETLFRIEAGGDYGFPYCMYDPRVRHAIAAPAYLELADSLQRRCSESPRPIAALPAHSAPMALAWATETGFPATYRNIIFVAAHGSLFHAPLDPRGYAVLMVNPADSSVIVFADGRSRFGSARPSGLAIGPDGSLYVSDDFKQRIWLIRWAGSPRAR